MKKERGTEKKRWRVFSEVKEKLDDEYFEINWYPLRIIFYL